MASPLASTTRPQCFLILEVKTFRYAVAPANPVYIPIGIWPYPVIFNSEALERLDITSNGPPDDRNVRIQRDPSSGEPTGLVEGMIFYNRTPPRYPALRQRPSQKLHDSILTRSSGIGLLVEIADAEEPCRERYDHPRRRTHRDVLGDVGDELGLGLVRLEVVASSSSSPEP